MTKQQENELKNKKIYLSYAVYHIFNNHVVIDATFEDMEWAKLYLKHANKEFNINHFLWEKTF